nr:GNAT family N-acetyltransferase [Pseudomonas sp. GW531-T4]
MLIRKAHGDDAQRVFVIRNQAINHQCSGHYPAADLQVWTAGSLGDYFVEVLEKTGHVAVIDDQVTASGMLDLESGQVDAVFVDPAYMGRGIGRQMMNYLEQLARQAGLPPAPGPGLDPERCGLLSPLRLRRRTDCPVPVAPGPDPGLRADDQASGTLSPRSFRV